jgi:phosphoglycolate phosphatase
MPTIVWDYDGTLHNSMRIYAPAVRSVFLDLKQWGLVKEVPEDKQIREWIGLTRRDMWCLAAPQLDREQQDSAGLMVGYRMRELGLQGQARLYPGAERVLSWVKAQSWSQLMLTNAGPDYLAQHRELFGLDQWFDAYYYPEGCGNRDKAELFKDIQEKFDGPWIMIGDRIQDIEAAKYNDAVALGCLYGYGGLGELEMADYTVASIGRIQSLLEITIYSEGSH